MSAGSPSTGTASIARRERRQRESARVPDVGVPCRHYPARLAVIVWSVRSVVDVLQGAAAESAVQCAPIEAVDAASVIVVLPGHRHDCRRSWRREPPP
jgi:hypothetical protein